MVNWPGVRKSMHNLQYNTTATSNDNLFAVSVVSKCKLLIEMGTPNQWAVNKSVARAETVRKLSEISSDIGVSSHVNGIVLTEMTVNAMLSGSPISN